VGTEASNLKVAAAPRVYSPFADESAPTKPLCWLVVEGTGDAGSVSFYGSGHLEIGPKPGAHDADKEPDRAWERSFFRTLIKKVVDRQKKFSSFFPACRKPL
jgi:hypothetical protein